ncbi:MAG: MFS transporter [Candidatus Parvarchaeota archaeon]
MQEKPTSPPPTNRKWFVLVGYMLVSMSSQIVWLNFAGIVSPQMQNIFNVGLGPISLMSGLWPLIFIPISIPTGLMIDRWGFKRVVSIGGIIIAIFSWLRLLNGRSFELLFVFQSLAAIGQPFIYNGISKLAGNWFPEGEQAIANGIATMGQIIGMVIALVLVPVMVPSAVFSELQSNIIVVSLIASFSVIFFIAFARETPSKSGATHIAHEKMGVEIKYLLRKKNIILIMFLFLIGVGIFSGLIQWVEAILFSKGISSLYGGLVGAGILISGIFGMVIIPLIADKYSKLKQIVVVNSLLVALLLFLFSLRVNLPFYVIVGVIIGFTLLSLAPVILQISLETAGKERAGAAASMVWLMSQVGALSFILIMPALDSFQLNLGLMTNDQWFISLVFCGIMMLVAVGLGSMLNDTRKVRKPQ